LTYRLVSRRSQLTLPERAFGAQVPLAWLEAGSSKWLSLTGNERLAPSPGNRQPALGVGLVEIDHLLTAVADAEAAGADFERLGFTVTPLSVIGSMGLANRLVLLDPLTQGTANFIELMALHDPARANPTMRSLLDGAPGIRSLVMASFDAEATRAALEAQGHAPGPVHKVAREWVLPSGERLDVAFDVLLPTAAPFAFNVCRYHTLQHYLRPEWRAHPNGSQSLVAVHAVTEDPAAATAFYAQLLGRPAERGEHGSFAVGPGAVRLTISTPSHAAALFGGDPPKAAGYVGYTIRVGNLAKAAALLASRGVPAVRGRDRALVVSPQAGQGNLIRFIE